MPELATADAEMMAAFNAQNGNGKSTMIVRFYRDVVRDDRASDGWHESKFSTETGKEFLIRHEGQGRDIYVEVDWVEIRAPGNKDEIRVRPARYPHDKLAYPEQYAAFKQGLADPQTGTPLSLVPGLTKPQVMELAFLGIKTAENLRDCSDVDGQKIMDFQRAKRRAIDFLELQAGAAPTEKLRSELALRDQEISGLKAMQEEMKKAIEELRKKK